MTNEECQNITIGELIEKRKELVRLTTKAERMKKQLKLAMTAIEVSLNLLPKRTNEATFEHPKESEWPSYSDVASIYKSRLEVCKRINELTNRLRSWGAID